MVENADDTTDLERLRNLPIRSEEIGFSSDELIACDKCSRRNAPDRPACLYCGAAINTSVAKRIELAELESWEHGFNVVAAAGEIDSERVAGELGSTLRYSYEWVGPLLRSRKAFPIARVGTSDEATSITELLASLSVHSFVVRDADLLLNGPPVRLRSVEFSDDGIRLDPFSGADSVVLLKDDLALVVSCVILKERQESTEKKKRRSTTTINESSVSSDLPIIDIYSMTDPTGWRISISGFDFSALGDEKSLLAHENLKRMAKRLSEFAPTVRFVDDYMSVRSALEICWPSERRKDVKSPNILELGSRKTTSVLTSDNTMQVTKYSRLQWHLL